MGISSPGVSQKQLDAKADKNHNHEITTLLNFDSALRTLINSVLVEKGLTTGVGAPPPAPAPSPAPSPGVGTGVVETQVPRRTQPGGIGNPAAGIYVFNIGVWALGNEAYDKITLTARVLGQPVGVVSWTSDTAAADILAVCTFGASANQIGGVLSAQVDATNEKGTTTEFIDGVYITAASTTPGFGGTGAGSTSPPASGSLSFTSLAVPTDFSISSITGVRSWAVMPTFAGIVKKAGGELLTIAKLGTTGVSDDTDGQVVLVSWTGGDPVASGSTTYGVLTPWNTPGEGLHCEALADTTERTCVIDLSAYSCMVNVAVTLSDSSASPLLIPVPASTLLTGTVEEDSVTAPRFITFKFKAGSAGQKVLFDITTVSFAGDGGNCHIQAIYIF